MCMACGFNCEEFRKFIFVVVLKFEEVLLVKLCLSIGLLDSKNSLRNNRGEVGLGNFRLIIEFREQIYDLAMTCRCRNVFESKVECYFMDCISWKHQISLQFRKHFRLYHTWTTLEAAKSWESKSFLRALTPHLHTKISKSSWRKS